MGILLLFISGFAHAAASADGISFFEQKVRPLLVEHCYECHSFGATRFGRDGSIWNSV